MNDKLSTYFKNFNEQLTDDLGSTFDYQSLLAYGKRKRNSLHLEGDLLEYPWVDEVEVIIEKIKTIVNNVNPKIDPEKEFVNSEFDTFEDRYIVFLIDQLSTLLSTTSSNLASSTRNLGDYFINRHIPFMQLNKLKDFDALGKHTSLYLKEEKKLINMLASLGTLMETNYYNLLKKSVKFDEKCVCINSVLANDPVYSDCYDFYKRFEDIMSTHYDLPEATRGIDYQNYVFLSLVLALDERGFELSGKSPEFDNKDYLLRVKNLKLERGDVLLVINTDSEDHIDLLFEDTTSNARRSKRTSKVSLDLYPSLDKNLSSKEEASGYFNRKLQSRYEKGYDNAYIITSIEGTQSEHIIVSSPFVNLLDANLNNMIESCLILFPADSFTYSHFCPVCGGNVEGEDENGNYTCSVCGSFYTLLINKDKKEIAWLKRLRNLEGK